MNETALEIVREFVIKDNKTFVRLTLFPNQNLSDLDYYELIPKCALELLNANVLDDNQIEFINKNFEIVEEDPLVVWHLGTLNAGNPLSLDYVIDWEVLQECADLFEGVGIGNINLPPRLENPKPVKDFDWSKWLTILLIPLIAGVLIYFARFDSELSQILQQGEFHENVNIPKLPTFSKLKLNTKLDSYLNEYEIHIRFKKMFKQHLEKVQPPDDVDSALRNFHMKRTKNTHYLHDLNKALQKRKK